MRRIKKYTAGFIVIPCGMLFLVLGCNNQPVVPVQNAAASTPQHTFTQKGAVREITIQPENQEFPEHEGKAEFVSYCGICHSLRYITMQPAFPRKTWEAEVHKMVEKYGAPIDSTNSRKVVDYLMAINGTPDK